MIGLISLAAPSFLTRPSSSLGAVSRTQPLHEVSLQIIFAYEMFVNKYFIQRANGAGQNFGLLQMADTLLEILGCHLRPPNPGPTVIVGGPYFQVKLSLWTAN